MDTESKYIRSKDYTALKEKHRKSTPYSYVSHRNNQVSLNKSEKLGLRLIICAVLLTVIIVGEMLNINTIIQFEQSFVEVISDDRTSDIKNTRIVKMFYEKDEIEETVPVVNTNDKSITEINNLDNYEDTVIEKK